MWLHYNAAISLQYNDCCEIVQINHLRKILFFHFLLLPYITELLDFEAAQMSLENAFMWIMS